MKPNRILVVLVGVLALGLVFTLGTLTSAKVEAQMTSYAGALTGWPVKLTEDFMRQHGLQVNSWFATVPDGSLVAVTTVPAGKRLVVTDVVANEPCTVDLLLQDGTPKAYVGLTSASCVVSFNSGFAYEENQTSVLAQNNPELETRQLAITGYFVDL
ncbi:MAG: hypothetical protein AB1486_29040 [Planctomycetota bacterium]